MSDPATDPTLEQTDGVAHAGSRRSHNTLVYLVVALAMFMSSVDQTIVATALPAIGNDLHAQVNWTGWTVTIYALGRMLVLPIAGKLSDQFGARNVFLFATVAFTTSSLLCGLSDDIYVLVALRGLQALGGGAFMPAGTGVLAATFGANRDRAVGSLITMFSIGGLIGPALGGIFVEYWSWRGIFLVNVPVGAVMLILALKVLPHSRPQQRAPFDLVGMAYLAVAILSSMVTLSVIGEASTSIANPLPWIFAVVGTVFGWLFVRHVNRDPDPFISARLLSGKGFGSMNAINFLYGSAALGFGALVPLYARQRYGIGSLASGTLLSARAVGVIMVSGIATFALRHTGYRWPMVCGFVICAGGLVGSSFAPVGLSPYAWLAVMTAIAGIGVGIATPASNNASMQLAPDQLSAVAGLRAMFRQAGSIAAVSLTTAVIARSDTPGVTQGYMIFGFAMVLLLTVPLIRRVPEHFGLW